MNGKLYLIGNGDENEVYDISSNVWSTWPALPVQTGVSPCMVVWRDSFIVFGGETALTTVQAFNLTSQVFCCKTRVLIKTNKQLSAEAADNTVTF